MASIPELRDYQKRNKAQLYEKWQSGLRDLLYVAATGSGKTVVMSSILRDVALSGARAMLLVDRDPLVEQSVNELNQSGIDAGVVKSGYPLQLERHIQVVSLQTLHHRLDQIPQGCWNLLMFDEAHTTRFYQVSIALRDRNPQARTMGATATPYRNGKESLADYFEDLECAPQPHELIGQKHLSPMRYFGYQDLDLRDIGITRGDFDENELDRLVNQKQYIQAMIDAYKSRAWGRRTIAFAVSIPHSQAIAEDFTAAGIPAAHVDAHTKNCKDYYQALERGELKLLSSVSKLAVGFNCKPVSCVFNRPTLSRALAEQMDGRGTRLSPETGKTDCIIFDSGNALRFGRLDEPKIYSLDPPAVTGTRPAPRRTCALCQAIATVTAKVCPECGELFPVRAIADFPTVLRLEELLTSQEQEQLATYRQLARYAYEHSYPPSWAAQAFRARFGVPPADWWCIGAVFGSQAGLTEQQRYRDHLIEIAQQQGCDRQWVESWMEREFSRS
jgi:hypothetical protein